jgi:hypothetical protein
MLSDKDIAVLAAVVLSVIGFVSIVRSQRRQPLPPGPLGYAVVGNMFDFPMGSKPWVTLGEWADQYGVSIYVCVKYHIISLYPLDIVKQVPLSQPKFLAKLSSLLAMLTYLSSFLTSVA